MTGPIPRVKLVLLLAAIAATIAGCQAPPSDPTWENQQRLERGHYG